jgi:hypothetical protein
MPSHPWLCLTIDRKKLDHEHYSTCFQRMWLWRWVGERLPIAWMCILKQMSTCWVVENKMEWGGWWLITLNFPDWIGKFHALTPNYLEVWHWSTPIPLALTQNIILLLCSTLSWITQPKVTRICQLMISSPTYPSGWSLLQQSNWDWGGYVMDIRYLEYSCLFLFSFDN